MARHEEEREDLLAEATALVERAELQLPDEPEPVVIGFRRDGCASCYFGADSAYHFNSSQQLRRAYVGGCLYKAERERLIRLVRQRTAGEVQLRRHDLDAAEAQAFLREMVARLDRLRRALAANVVAVVRQVPADADCLTRCRNWLAKVPAIPEIARTPRVG